MADPNLHHLAGAYSLDAIDPQEREAFEAHLATCDACRQEVFEFSSVHATLASAQAVNPPPALKSRVLDEIARTRQVSPLTGEAAEAMALSSLPARTRFWSVASLAAAVAVIVLFLAITVFSTGNDTDEFASGLATVLEQPDAQMIELDEQSGGVGRFKVAWSNSLQRAVLIGDDLPPAPDGKAYELWLITDDASMAMHILDSAVDGTVHATLAMPQSPAVWAITVEPSVGAEIATGEVIFIASVDASQ